MLYKESEVLTLAEKELTVEAILEICRKAGYVLEYDGKGKCCLGRYFPDKTYASHFLQDHHSEWLKVNKFIKAFAQFASVEDGRLQGVYEKWINEGGNEG